MNGGLGSTNQIIKVNEKTQRIPLSLQVGGAARNVRELVAFIAAVKVVT